VLCSSGKRTTKEYDLATCDLGVNEECSEGCITAGFTNPDDGLIYKKRTTVNYQHYVSEIATAPGQGTSCESSRESTITDVEEYVGATLEENCTKLATTRTGTSVAMYKYWQLLPTVALLYSIECTSTRNPDGTWDGSITEDGVTTTFTGAEYPCGVGDCPEPVINENTTTVTYEDLSASESEDYSLEYTTADLKAAALAALPADYPNTTPGSYFNLTADELTNAIREAVLWFTFPAPVSRGRPNPCYQITWKERFTPTTGSPVDTPKSWTWDGEIPEGYDPEDEETWPRSPDFTVPIPTANGTTTVEDVEFSCTDCE
jgi:hypothetical protein